MAFHLGHPLFDGLAYLLRQGSAIDPLGHRARL
jgi:hypothetical protein